MALITFPTVGTVLTVGGHSEPPYSDAMMRSLLSGAFAGFYNRVSVPYPYNDANLANANNVGIGNLISAINEWVMVPDIPVVVLGVSQGAMILDQVMALVKLPPSKIQFVAISDPGRPGGMSVAPEPPPTPYGLTWVVQQYDGFAHWPGRPSWIARLNALMGTGAMPGSWSAHGAARFANLAAVPSENIRTTTNVLGGVTTKYLVPSPVLPLIGRDNASLRATIDTAYG